MSQYKIWECQVCGWIYDESKGDPDEGFAPGTRWEDIPEDWLCPECGVGKEDFEMRELVAALSPAPAPAPAPAPVLSPKLSPEPAPVAASSNDALPIVIIGTGLAGYNLLKEIRRQDKEQPVVMFTADDGVYYSKPALSTGFANNKKAEDLAMASAEEMAERFNAQIHIFTRISAIDTATKIVSLQAGGQIKYASLVLATGASCIQPRLEGNGLGAVHSVNDRLDYARFRTLAKNKKRVLIIGAGLIGCEFANDLALSEYEVEVVDMLDRPLAALLPPEASARLKASMEQKGIGFHFGQALQSVETHGAGIVAVTQSGKQLHADIVLSAIGVRPDVTLASQAGLEINKGIVVSPSLKASADGVFALGDCAEVHGDVKVYIQPLMLQAKALAKTLVGETTEVVYSVMPVAIKTPLHAVVANPPAHGSQGSWVIDTDTPDGVRARFVSETGDLLGYALTGDQVRAQAELNRACLR